MILEPEGKTISLRSSSGGSKPKAGDSCLNSCMSTVLDTKTNLGNLPKWETCLGLRYFVTEEDSLWRVNDTELINLVANQLESLGLVASGVVEAGYVERVPKAYHVYDAGHVEADDTIRKCLVQKGPRSIL